MSEPTFTIAPAAGQADLDAARALFRAYAASLPIDLAYQGFATELATLPGAYAAPAGALLLARDGAGAAIGCAALRPLAEPGCCEMKRLFVAPTARGLGLGRVLMEAIVGEAARLGYREVRLDTLPTMTAAIAMYRAAGSCRSRRTTTPRRPARSSSDARLLSHRPRSRLLLLDLHLDLALRAFAQDAQRHHPADGGSASARWNSGGSRSAAVEATITSAGRSPAR